MKDLLAEIGINVGISVAGLFGSLLMLGKRAVINLRTTFFSIVSGVASANYITPIVVEMTGFDKAYELSIGFVLGFLGLKSVEKIGNRIFHEQNTSDDPDDN
jgi:hypothetical protein